MPREAFFSGGETTIRLEPEQEKALANEPCADCTDPLGDHVVQNAPVKGVKELFCTTCGACRIRYSYAYAMAVSRRQERGLPDFPAIGLPTTGDIRPRFEPLELPPDLFDAIVGHDDVKLLLKGGLTAPKPVHFLLYGPPASAKTIFLMETERIPGAYYAVGSTATRAGIRQLLVDTMPRVLIIDELEKIQNVKDLAVLLSIMETGVLTETMFGRHERIVYPLRVFAAANEIDAVKPELMSRFQKVRFRAYTQTDFLFVARWVLENREGLDPDLATRIAYATWNTLGSRDVRDAVRIARLLTKPEDLDGLVAALKRLQ